MKLATLRSFVFVVAPLGLTAGASAAEAATPVLASSVPIASAPLVLGAPPAWTVVALGAAVISVTLLRRARKALPPLARR